MCAGPAEWWAWNASGEAPRCPVLQDLLALGHGQRRHGNAAPVVGAKPDGAVSAALAAPAGSDHDAVHGNAHLKKSATDPHRSIATFLGRQAVSLEAMFASSAMTVAAAEVLFFRWFRHVVPIQNQVEDHVELTEPKSIGKGVALPTAMSGKLALAINRHHNSTPQPTIGEKRKAPHGM